MEGQKHPDQMLFTLAYIPFFFIGFIVSLVLILTKKEDRDARYHGYHGLAITAIAFVCGIIPIIGWIALVGVLVYSIMLAIQVSKGEYPVIPTVTDFLRKYIDEG